MKTSEKLKGLNHETEKLLHTEEGIAEAFFPANLKPL